MEFNTQCTSWDIETKRKNFTKAVEHYEIALKLTKAYKLVYDQKLIYSSCGKLPRIAGL